MRMTVDFSSEIMKIRRKWHKNAEKKEMSTQNLIPGESIL